MQTTTRRCFSQGSTLLVRRPQTPFKQRLPEIDRYGRPYEVDPHSRPIKGQDKKGTGSKGASGLIRDRRYKQRYDDERYEPRRSFGGYSLDSAPAHDSSGRAGSSRGEHFGMRSGAGGVEGRREGSGGFGRDRVDRRPRSFGRPSHRAWEESAEEQQDFVREGYEKPGPRSRDQAGHSSSPSSSSFRSQSSWRDNNAPLRERTERYQGQQHDSRDRRRSYSNTNADAYSRPSSQSSYPTPPSPSPSFRPSRPSSNPPPTPTKPSSPPSLRSTAQWEPTKRLTYPAMAGLRALHKGDPKAFNPKVLSEKFGISYEAVQRILKSKWQPTFPETESGTTGETAQEGYGRGGAESLSPAAMAGMSPVPAIERALAMRYRLQTALGGTSGGGSHRLRDIPEGTALPGKGDL